MTMQRPNERGINIVDLMMWLVIAALLLASAIQGIGFYQQRAYVEQMANDVNHAGQVAVTLAADSNGVLSDTIVRQAVKDTETTGEVSLMSKSLGAGYFAIEAMHPAVTKNRVVYAFDTREKLNPGVNITKIDSIDTHEYSSLASTCPANNWTARYYTNTMEWSGTPHTERCEAGDLYRQWYLDAPASGINVDRFSSLWSKNFVANEAGEYDFSIIGDDYVGVYLDGRKILEADHWYGTNKPTQKIRLTVTAGTHNIVVKHNERGGGASIRFVYGPAAG